MAEVAREEIGQSRPNSIGTPSILSAKGRSILQAIVTKFAIEHDSSCFFHSDWCSGDVCAGAWLLYKSEHIQDIVLA